MITRAQSKQYAPQRPYHIKPKLTAMEKCLLRWTMAERGDKVLDAHVGNGLMLEYLQRNMECDIYGVSDDMEAVRETRSRLRNADIAFASREDIPWQDQTFDSVYLKMQHMPVTEASILEILRVLKPSGQLLIGFCTIPAPLRQLASIFRPEHEEEMRKPAARKQAMTMMRDMGLTQITWQQTGLFLSVGIGWKPLEPNG